MEINLWFVSMIVCAILGIPMTVVGAIRNRRYRPDGPDDIVAQPGLGLLCTGVALLAAGIWFAIAYSITLPS